MDEEIDPLPDEVLVTMEEDARAYLSTHHPLDGGVVRLGYGVFHSLITEVRRLRAERVRWEALRLAAVAVANEERWCPYADVEDGERYYAPSSDDVDTLQAVVAALTT